MRYRILIMILLPMIGVACSEPDLKDKLRASHIQGNAPEENEFDRLLRRDLSSYFNLPEEADPKLQYFMLRKGATQSGLSYPKYYVWTVAELADSSIIEGAVRVAAVEKSRFEVTDFVSRAEIQADPKAVEAIFPSALVPLLLEYSKGE